MEFSSVLLSLRQENGLSQRQVAADLNISQALLSHYEKGIREPRLDFVLRICDYYGVSADYLLGRTDTKDSVSLFGHGSGKSGEQLRNLVLTCSALAAVCENMEQTAMEQELLQCIGFSLAKLCTVFGLPGSKASAAAAAAWESLSKEAEARLWECRESIENYSRLKENAMEKLSEQSPALSRALRDFTDSANAYFNPTR